MSVYNNACYNNVCLQQCPLQPLFQDLGINVLHIESRPSGRRESEYEILVEVKCDNRRMEQLMPMLRREVAAINLDTFEQGGELPPPTPLSATASFGEFAACISRGECLI